MGKATKLVFFGTPELARSVLAAVADSPAFRVLGAVCQPDKPVGRDQTLTPPPVKREAEARGIPVFQPEKVRNNAEFFAKLRGLGADIFLVVAYGRILPKELLEIPRIKCVNVHGSLLPKWRGAAPIQYSLMAGETVTGATLMEMDEGMDTGAMIAKFEIPVDERETSATLFAKFAAVSGPFVVRELPRYAAGELKAVPQDHAAATHAKMLEKDDGKMDFSRNARELFWLWRGVTPWPGAWANLDGKKVIFEECDYDRSAPDAPGEPGLASALPDGRLRISCGAGALVVSRLKPEGKKSQGSKDFLNGRGGREIRFS